MNRYVPWLVIFAIACFAGAGMLKSKDRREKAISAKLMSLGAKNEAPWTFRFNKTDFVVNGRRVTLKHDGFNLSFKAVSDTMLELLVAYETKKINQAPNVNVVVYSRGCLFDPGYWIYGKPDNDKGTGSITLGKVSLRDSNVARKYTKELIDWKTQRTVPKLKAEADK